MQKVLQRWSDTGPLLHSTQRLLQTPTPFCFCEGRPLLHTNKEPTICPHVGREVALLILEMADMRQSFKRVNHHKALGPDVIPGHGLRACTNHPLPSLSLGNQWSPVWKTTALLHWHGALTHLEKVNAHVRMLFVDYSWAFNTTISSKPISKLDDLGLGTTICRWILDFLKGRPQVVRIVSQTSSLLILNMGMLQGYVLSPLLFIHKYNSKYNSSIIIKVPDDTPSRNNS